MRLPYFKLKCFAVNSECILLSTHRNFTGGLFSAALFGEHMFATQLPPLSLAQAVDMYLLSVMRPFCISLLSPGEPYMRWTCAATYVR
jgi:hypothetical protein